MKVIMNGEWVRNLEGHVNSIPVHGLMNNLIDLSVYMYFNTCTFVGVN